MSYEMVQIKRNYHSYNKIVWLGLCEMVHLNSPDLVR